MTGGFNTGTINHNNNCDYVEYVTNNTVPTLEPPKGVDTRVLLNGDRYEWDGTQWIKQIVDSCPIELTRGALLALRNSASLDPCAHYRITDYNRGTVGAAKILLHAVDPSTLGLQAHIKTTHDNTAWDGRYDIDTNRLIYLADNIGNEVNEETAVDNFPWGVAAVNNNRVDSARIAYTAGTVAFNQMSANANLTISGGSFTENTVAEDAQVTIISGTHYENSFGKSTIFTQVGTGYIRYSEIDGTTSWINGNTNVSNVTAQTATVNTTGSAGTISNSTFDRAYAPSMQNVASLTINDTTVSNYGQISVTGAAGLYLYRSTVTDGSRVLISAGSRIDASYLNIDSYGYVQSTGNGGFLRVNYSNVSSLGYIRNLTTNTHYVERSNVSSSGRITFEGDSTDCRVYYSQVSSGATMMIAAGSTACYFYYCTATSLGQISTTNSTNARIYYSSSTDYSYLRVYGTNTGQSIIYYCNAHGRGYIEHLNITARLRYYSIDASSQAIVRGTATGNANLYYSSFCAYYYLLATFTAGTKSALHGYGRRSYTVTDPPSGTFTQNF